MTHLRQRIIEWLQLRGLSERTQVRPFAFTEDIFFNDAFFPCRLFESGPSSPIIPVSDSQLFSIFGKEAGVHRLF